MRGEAKPLDILLVVDRTGVLRQYATVVEELARRGHRVTIGYRAAKENLPARLTALESVRVVPAPGREADDGWAPVAWTVRALGDLARYAHPRYEQAPVLRRRMARKVVGRLCAARSTVPGVGRLAASLARRLAAGTDVRLSERVVRAAGKLEAAIPTSAAVDRFVREQAPDALLVASAMKTASSQVEFLKSARRLGIPAASLVASWDNLTNKGLLKVVPERVFVWNEVQRREAVELHGVPSERVVVTGAQLFDPWFERRPSTARDEFLRRVGLDPAEPYVLFVGSSPFVTNHSQDEVRFVERWLEALRASGDERLRRIGVLVRPHPVGKGWRAADLSRFPGVAIWPHRSERPVEAGDQDEFYDSLAHSAAVVGINTTAMIEAAVVGKSVLTVLAPEFAQESTLHFHYLLEENGGFLHVASSLEEHAAQLLRVLDEHAADQERRRRFVESFVRPHGLHRPATPIFADAVEELATLPVERERDLVAALLRPPLGTEAALVWLAIRAGRRRRALRHLRRRVAATARRHRLLPSRSL